MLLLTNGIGTKIKINDNTVLTIKTTFWAYHFSLYFISNMPSSKLIRHARKLKLIGIVQKSGIKTNPYNTKQIIVNINEDFLNTFRSKGYIA